MNTILAFVTLAMVATCYSLPVDMGIGEIIKKDDLDGWSKNFVIAGQPIQIGVGWKPDGTLAVGGRIEATVSNQPMPISAAVSYNYKAKDSKPIQYEVGTKILDQFAGVVYGDLNGEIKYLVNGWVPVQEKSLNQQEVAVGASVEGDSSRSFVPSSLTAGVSLDDKVIQAKADLDTNWGLENVNVQVGADSQL